MSDQTRIYVNPDGTTAQVSPNFVPGGPADPKAPAVQKFYTVVAGVLGLVGIAATFGLITADQAASLGAVGTAATTLAGAGVAAVASFRTKKQLGNGTFTEAPVLPAVPALEQLAILRDAADQELTRGIDNAKAGANVLTGVLNSIPGVGGQLGGVVQQGSDLLGAFRRGQ